jgi:hypothetical protein
VLILRKYSGGCLAKNCLITVHGVTPYQAVLGRTPRALSDFEGAGLTAIMDNTGTVNNHSTRLRELSLQTMVRGIAEDR